MRGFSKIASFLSKELINSKRSKERKMRSALSNKMLRLEGLEQRIVPFKPYTHLAIVSEARADLIDDGKVTIEGNSYTVPAEVVAAIRDNPEYFNAGAVGPDGFPDITFGQSVIHPTDSGLWLDHILSSARAWTGSDRPQVLAWSYGFLTHAIGDMWAHTLVNEFSGGPFPGVDQLVSEQQAKSNALKHVIIEGYIADATPGFDGNPDRTTLPDGDVSNDSTPEIRFAAPNRFIYETFVKDGSGPAGNTSNKGLVIDGFKALRDKLRTIAGPRPAENPDLFVASFSKTKAAYEKVASASSLGDFLSIDYAKALLDLGISAIGDGLNALKSSARNIFALNRDKLYSMYLHSWADNIEEGLQHYGEFGLAMTNGFFNPQSKRNAQNNGQFGSEFSQSRIDAENKISSISATMYELSQDNTASAHDGMSFIENHFLPMLGVPKFLTVIADRVGDVSSIFSSAYSQALENALQGIREAYPELVSILNPIQNTAAQIQAQIQTVISDLQSAILGVDISEVQSLLANPSAHLDDAQISTRYGNIPLFQPDDHAKLDSYLGITDPTHHSGTGGILGDDVTYNRNSFAALGNAVTMTKLLFLDGNGLDQVMSDLSGSKYVLYGPANGSIMTTILPGVEGADGSSQWLLSLDGDHAWRSDRQPLTGDGKPGAGNGNFPLWEDSRLRDTVFRRLFKDWQNGPLNFPDLGDLPTQPGNLSPLTTPSQSIAGGPLTINLSAADDLLTVATGTGADSKAVYTITWTQVATGVVSTTNYLRDGITKIVVQALSGNDTVKLGGAIPVPVEFVGGEGIDGVIVDDGAATSGAKAVLAATSLNGTRGVAGGLSWDFSLEKIALNLGGLDDELSIQGDITAFELMVNGNDGNDRIIFSPGSVMEGQIDGGKGQDVIQSLGGASSVIQIIGLGAADGFRIGGLPFVSGNISNIDGIAMLGAKADLLVGMGRTTTWQITGINTGLYRDEASSRVFAFSSLESLLGGSGDDRFVLGASASVSGMIDGSEGNDSIEYADSAKGSIILSELGLVDGFNGNTGSSGPVAGGFRNMNGAAGGASNPADRFVGLGTDSVWNMQAGRVADVYSTQGRSMSISRFEVLNGGGAVDRFVLDYSTGKLALAPAIAISGGNGVDSLLVVGSTGDDSFTFVGPFLMVDGKTVRISTIESIQVNAGDGNDEVIIAGSLVIGMKSLSVDLGAGNDKATISPSFRTAIRVDGGSGADSLVVIAGFIRSQGPVPSNRAQAGVIRFPIGASVTFATMESWRKI